MELKPCPFCGNEVHLKAKPLWRPGGHGYYGCYEYIIQCDNIECGCRLTNRGETLTLTQWSERFGISKTTLKERLNSGWPIEDALLKPVRPRGAKMDGGET